MPAIATRDPASPAEIGDQLKRLVLFRPPIARTDPAFAELIREYAGFLRRYTLAELRAAIDHTIERRTERSWPLPAEIAETIDRLRESTPTEGEGWVSVPARWRHDTRLIELRRMCRPEQPDPLPRIASAIGRHSKTDPWLTMRGAMCERANGWESFADERWPTGSVEAIRIQRAIVERRAADAGIAVDLSGLPLEVAPAA